MSEQANRTTIYEYGLTHWTTEKNKFIKSVLHIDDTPKTLGLFITTEDILCSSFISIVLVHKKNKVSRKTKPLN